MHCKQKEKNGLASFSKTFPSHRKWVRQRVCRRLFESLLRRLCRIRSRSRNRSRNRSQKAIPLSPLKPPQLKPTEADLSDFDGQAWALRTVKQYPTWTNQDAIELPRAIEDAYIEAIQREGAAQGGPEKTADWMLAKVRAYAEKMRGTDPKYIPYVVKFFREGLYSQVEIPGEPSKPVVFISDAERAKQLQEEKAKGPTQAERWAQIERDKAENERKAKAAVEQFRRQMAERERQRQAEAEEVV